MSEVERRIGYNPYRILIDVERTLNPSFNGQGVYLTGAQVEILRNISAYLGVRSTFVDEYHGTYYLMPDDSDWDAIQKIVADMEEKLSNNDNVLWGYNERWVESLDLLAGVPGTHVKATTPVPGGKVLVVTGIAWSNFSGARGPMQLRVKSGVHMLQLAYEATPAQYDPVLWSGKIDLAEGDHLSCKQDSVSGGDALYGEAWGYWMLLPA